MKIKNNTHYTPKEGDIVAWDNPSTACTSIAVMMNADEFSVCLNFRARKGEDSRIWEWDNTPINRVIRRADSLEMARLFVELVTQGYEFSAVDGKVNVSLDIDDDDEPKHEPEPEPDQKPEPEPEPKVEVKYVVVTRNDRFANYIYEVAKLYQRTSSFRNVSDISSQNRISSIRRDVMYKSGLHELADPEWLRTVEGRSYCDNMYEYALHHTTQIPLIPKSQRI